MLNRSQFAGTLERIDTFAVLPPHLISRNVFAIDVPPVDRPERFGDVFRQSRGRILVAGERPERL